MSRLSQARRHSLGHSQITKTVSEYEATAARPSGRDEDHFLALNGAQTPEQAGTTGKSGKEDPLQAWYSKLPAWGLAWQSRFTFERVQLEILHSVERRVLQGFGHHAVIDAFISINAFGALGAPTLGLRHRSLHVFHLRSEQLSGQRVSWGARLFIDASPTANQSVIPSLCS